MSAYTAPGTLLGRVDRRVQDLETGRNPLRLPNVTDLPPASEHPNAVLLHAGVLKVSDGTTWSAV